jgi:SM-20-related protein
MFAKIMHEFLGPEIRSLLYQFACANKERFAPTLVGANSELKKMVRVSHRLTELGAMREVLEQRVSAEVPRLVADLRLTPFKPSGYEIELVAHGDGAFYGRHLDLFTGSERTDPGGDRLISVVYYFYREPKSFKGGELRLYPLPSPASPEELRLEILPEQDTAVAFSSWMAHEVMPVSCPSCAFADSRFSVNCWVLA